jgi:hypothetical protein
LNRPASFALAFLLPALAACSGTAPAAKGVIPPGTPPPDYETPRAYNPAPPAASAAPATTADPDAVPDTAPAKKLPPPPPGDDK